MRQGLPNPPQAASAHGHPGHGPDGSQSLGPKASVSYQVPSNKASFLPEKSPKLGDIKLIDYDFAKYGSSAERRRLLSKWDKEVKNLPK